MNCCCTVCKKWTVWTENVSHSSKMNFERIYTTSCKSISFYVTQPVSLTLTRSDMGKRQDYTLKICLLAELKDRERWKNPTLYNCVQVARSLLVSTLLPQKSGHDRNNSCHNTRLLLKSWGLDPCTGPAKLSA